MAVVEAVVPDKAPASTPTVISAAADVDFESAAKKAKKDDKVVENPVVFLDVQIGGQDVGRVFNSSVSRFNIRK